MHMKAQRTNQRPKAECNSFDWQTEQSSMKTFQTKPRD